MAVTRDDKNNNDVELPRSTGEVEFDGTATTVEFGVDTVGSTGVEEFDSKNQHYTQKLDPDAVVVRQETPGPVFMALNNLAADQLARLRAEHEKVVGLTILEGQDDGPQARTTYRTPTGVKDVSEAYSASGPKDDGNKFVIETEQPRTDQEAPDQKPADAPNETPADGPDPKTDEDPTPEQKDAPMEPKTKVIKPEPKAKPAPSDTTAKTK